MNITEKTSYLKGLLEGLNIDKNKPEGKLLSEIIDTLDTMAKDFADLSDYVDEIDTDLESAEEIIYGDDDGRCDDCECDMDCDECECDDNCEECDCGDECDMDCDNCNADCEDRFYQVECPKCGETICFDESCDPRNLTCPACNETFDCVNGAKD